MKAMSTQIMTDSDLKDDLPFRHYTAKHRLIAWISAHLFDTPTYTVRHGLLKGMKRKGGLGWLPALFSPSIMSAEQQFWCGLNLRGMTVYDVGAFHGLLTLFFASRAKEVVCFEPNSQNHKRLMENLLLNGVKNVEVRRVGIGSQHETRTMVGIPLMPGGASVEEKTVEQSLQAGGRTSIEHISIVMLDEEIPQASLPAPDFIKIDIEGWEIEALRGARKTLEVHKPALFLEMHGETIREKRRKVARGRYVSVGYQLPEYPSHRDWHLDHAGKYFSGNGRSSVLPADLTRLSYASTTFYRGDGGSTST
jgi:FkbM family methyltransferase